MQCQEQRCRGQRLQQGLCESSNHRLLCCSNFESCREASHRSRKVRRQHSSSNRPQLGFYSGERAPWCVVEVFSVPLVRVLWSTEQRARTTTPGLSSRLSSPLTSPLSAFPDQNTSPHACSVPPPRLKASGRRREHPRRWCAACRFRVNTWLGG